MHDTAAQPFTPTPSSGRTPLAAVSLHLAIAPRRAVSWRVPGDAEIRVHGARVWLTCASSTYDYWLTSSDVLRVRRNERIWLSTDGDVAATVTLTYAPLRGLAALVACLPGLPRGRGGARRL